MSASASAIPFEAQSEPQTRRGCGAACLSMVYRSFGKNISQEEIWPEIAKQNRFGSLASTTHLMTQDALNRGLAAIAIQARHPLQALRLCLESGIHAILNHRPKAGMLIGHYTVLVDIDNKDVVLHDPFFGPNRRLSHAELLELWQPLANSEIVGNMLIGIAEHPSPATTCWLCQAPIAPAIECPNCNVPVPLQANTLLGCMNTACINRFWEYVCCPSCDYTWTFSIEPGQAGTPGGPYPSSPGSPDAQAPPSAEQPPWMKALFGEFDKLCNQVRGLPGAAGHPEVEKYLNLITAQKGRIVLAQSEALIYQEMSQKQLAKMQEAANQKKEAHGKKLEELTTPSSPLDGEALGRALLKNLELSRPH